jgi:site-specific DNA-methyltransferase (adenine-specific)
LRKEDDELTETHDYNGLLNRVTQGDCLEVMRLIPDKSIDMILCDLPYGTTACKWDTVIPFEPLWEQYERIIKDNGAIVLTASQPFTTKLIMSNFSLFKYCWYRNKENGGNFLIAKYMPQRVVEEICVFGKGRINYYPIMEEVEPEKIRPVVRCTKKAKEDHTQRISEFRKSKEYSNKYRYPKNLLTYNNRAGELNSNKRVHPTQKPVALFEYLIRTYTNEGEVVLDNCIGSGTTAVAAINTNRQFIGIEREPEYVEIANKRIAEALAERKAGAS